MKLQGVNPEFCSVRAQQSIDRSHLVELLRTSHRHTPLSEPQQAALTALSDPNSVAVTTGQQVGLFGGPMYTLYKIRNAVTMAQNIGSSTGIPCVPVFWLEDNDHDAAEAASTYLRTESGEVQHVTLWDGSDPRRPVAERIVDSLMRERITSSAALLTGRFGAETQERMREVYQEGFTWTDAFMSVLAPYLQEWGVLTLRAQDVVKHQAHRTILVQSLQLNNELVEAIRTSTREYESRGKHAQATVSDVPWFLLTDAGRQRIEYNDGVYRAGTRTFSHHELVDHAEEHPEFFSPTVLTRPIMQDVVLPNVMSVLGAAELAYHQQLPRAYTLLGITMPVLQQRSGMTLLPPKSERNLAKVNRPIDWFKRPLEEIEHDAAVEFTSDVLPDSSERVHIIRELLAPYREAAATIDPTLLATVQAQQAGIMSSLETLETKLRSAAKKQHATTMERLRTLHTVIYPMNTLQERVYPLASWEAEFGINGLRTQIESLQAP